MKINNFAKRITAIFCAGNVRHIILSTIILFAAIISHANTTTINGYTWSYDLIADAATITGVSPAKGDIMIPSNIGRYRVTSIGYAAFTSCSGLTSVIIPDSVTSIGNYAFSWCSGLTRVTIPDSVTNIGYSAFTYCSGLADDDGFFIFRNILYGYYGDSDSVMIPDSVTSIGDCAFYACSGLKSVTIPNSVTSIGASAFYRCSGLTSVTIPDSVTSIGDEAFHGCSGLTSVTIPDSVASLEDETFRGCNGLADGDGFVILRNVVFGYYGESSIVTIPDHVTNIGNFAFVNCNSLTSVIIPESVRSIGNGAFYGCSGLVSMMIPGSVTNIGYGAFYWCGSLTSVTIPDSVTSIGDYAFSECSGLTSVTIPDSVTSIGAAAFYGCSVLTSVTIPNTVTNIGDGAFSGCSALIKAYIPFSLKDSVEGLNVFDGCSSSLEKVYYNPISEIAVDADEVAVEEAVASVGFVDAAVKQMIGGSAEKYNAFKSWANGIAGGEAMAITSPYAAVSYLLGSTAVFKAEPKVEIESVAIKEPADSTQGQTINVEVVVKDGANAVKVATDKVAAMFEATSDLGDWNGEAKLTPVVSVLGTDQNGKMSFTVKPGDGKATRAFLRIKQ